MMEENMKSVFWSTLLVFLMLWQNSCQQKNSNEITTTGIAIINLPIMPDININGKKAATVVKIVVLTGPNSS